MYVLQVLPLHESTDHYLPPAIVAAGVGLLCSLILEAIRRHSDKKSKTDERSHVLMRDIYLPILEGLASLEHRISKLASASSEELQDISIPSETQRAMAKLPLVASLPVIKAVSKAIRQIECDTVKAVIGHREVLPKRALLESIEQKLQLLRGEHERASNSLPDGGPTEVLRNRVKSRIDALNRDIHDTLQQQISAIKNLMKKQTEFVEVVQTLVSSSQESRCEVVLAMRKDLRLPVDHGQVRELIRQEAQLDSEGIAESKAKAFESINRE